MSKYNNSQPFFSYQGGESHGQVQYPPPEQTKIADVPIASTYFLACLEYNKRCTEGRFLALLKITDGFTKLIYIVQIHYYIIIKISPRKLL